MLRLVVNVCEYDCWKYNCRCDNGPIHSENHYHAIIDELISSIPKDLIEEYIEKTESKRKRESEDWMSLRHRYISFFPTDNTDLWEQLGWEKLEYSESIFEYYVKKLYEKFYSE